MPKPEVETFTITVSDGVSERELIKVVGEPVGAVVLVHRTGELTTWRTMKLDGFDALPSHLTGLAKAEGLDIEPPEDVGGDII